MTLIDLDQVEKHFTVRRRTAGGRRRHRTVVRAVDGLSFAIQPGEIVGYLGPNGAGKSTTVKMLTGILMPSRGRITVAGLDPTRDRIALARRVGVVFGQRTTLWWDLPLIDSFDLVRRLYRVPAARYQRNLDRLCDLLELGTLLRTPVRQLSLGQRMRGDLAAALVHDPEIVYLDEPTIGLDIVSKTAVRNFLEAVNRDQGTTVLLTTHDLGDVERLCKRVMVIDHGRLAYDGDLDGLRALAQGERTLVVDLATAAPPLVFDRTRAHRVDGPRQWISVPVGQSVAQIVTKIVTEHDVLDISVEEPAIEGVVAHLYLKGRS